MTKAFDAIAAEIKGLFPGIRLRTLAVHDAAGEPVWMTDGVLGPDEHALSHEGLDLLRLEPARRCFERAHGDGGLGMVFPAREPTGDLRGALVVIADARNIGGTGQEKALKSPLQSLLRRIAVQLRALSNPTDATTGTALLGIGDDATVIAPTTDQRFVDLTLYVQQMLRLKTSGRTRRYEVLLRTRRAGSTGEEAPLDLITEADAADSRGDLDRHVIAQLVQWFARNRDSLEAEPASFSVNLSLGALVDPTFLDAVARMMELSQVNPRMLAFELRESVCRERATEVQRFVKRCEAMKCQVVIDDFTLNSDVLPMLRSPAVRLVKIDARLTADAMKDKLAQALVVAISQAAKVLGTHCVAKRIESTMARQWLAAVGVDFAQGFLLEGLVPLDSLSDARRSDSTQTTSTLTALG
ncbi:MAG: EAL domain-containing protein [Steroidobacteraceae bacterium]